MVTELMFNCCTDCPSIYQNVIGGVVRAARTVGVAGSTCRYQPRVASTVSILSPAADGFSPSGWQGRSRMSMRSSAGLMLSHFFATIEACVTIYAPAGTTNQCVAESNTGGCSVN